MRADEIKKREVAEELAARPMMSSADVCRRLKISARTLRRWRDGGLFPDAVVLAPKVLRWEASVVEEWIRDRGAWHGRY